MPGLHYMFLSRTTPRCPRPAECLPFFSHRHGPWVWNFSFPIATFSPWKTPYSSGLRANSLLICEVHITATYYQNITCLHINLSHYGSAFIFIFIKKLKDFLPYHMACSLCSPCPCMKHGVITAGPVKSTTDAFKT